MSPAPVPVEDRWIDVTDPESGRRWRFDADFLTSRWKCIWGQGCRGIHATQDPARFDGCCTDGAQLTDADDFATVHAAAARLGPETWQFSGVARRKGWFKRRPDGTIATRVVQEGCIFLNRPGFAGGVGCALHRASLERGEPVIDGKPYVCWQLPLRRREETDALGAVSVLRRWKSADFGPDRLHWWCTESSDAFVNDRPVYLELEAELRAVVGDGVYEHLVSELHSSTDRPSADGRGTAIGPTRRGRITP